MAFGLATLTDIYGAIPWTEAFDTEIETPAYDDQEFIYSEIIRLLKEAISHFGQESFLSVGSNDLIFGGDMDKWEALANQLIARNLNHLVKKSSYNPTEILSYVEAYCLTIRLKAVCRQTSVDYFPAGRSPSEAVGFRQPRYFHKLAVAPFFYDGHHRFPSGFGYRESSVR